MVKVKDAPNTYIVVGAYRIPIKREQYQAWEKALMQDVGFSDKNIRAEIMRRLGYEQN